MEDLSGLGKSANIESESTPKACSMSIGSNLHTYGWACDRTDCKAYGNVCPFSW